MQGAKTNSCQKSKVEDEDCEQSQRGTFHHESGGWSYEPECNREDGKTKAIGGGKPRRMDLQRGRTDMRPLNYSTPEAKHPCATGVETNDDEMVDRRKGCWLTRSREWSYNKMSTPYINKCQQCAQHPATPCPQPVCNYPPLLHIPSNNISTMPGQKKSAKRQVRCD